MAKTQNDKKFWQHKYFVHIALSGLISLVLVVQLIRWRLEVSANSSSTVFVIDPNQAEVKVVINKTVDLNKIPLQQILDSRAAEIAKYQNLISGEYQPTKVVFDGINENAYWMSAGRLFYSGKRPVKTYKFFNESAASDILLNPFLLVKAEFWGISIWGSQNLQWSKKEYPIEYLAQNNIPLTPQIQSLKFYPAQGNAEVTYDVSYFIETVNPLLQKPLTTDQVSFGLSMQNARDLGFRYSYLDIASSVNIQNDQNPVEALDLPDRFEYMPVAWTKKLSLNHSSPGLPNYQDIRPTALPAIAVVKLWYEQPKGVNQPANYIFKININ